MVSFAIIRDDAYAGRTFRHSKRGESRRNVVSLRNFFGFILKFFVLCVSLYSENNRKRKYHHDKAIRCDYYRRRRDGRRCSPRLLPARNPRAAARAIRYRDGCYGTESRSVAQRCAVCRYRSRIGRGVYQGEHDPAPDCQPLRRADRRSVSEPARGRAGVSGQVRRGVSCGGHPRRRDRSEGGAAARTVGQSGDVRCACPTARSTRSG